MNLIALDVNLFLERRGWKLYLSLQVAFVFHTVIERNVECAMAEEIEQKNVIYETSVDGFAFPSSSVLLLVEVKWMGIVASDIMYD